MIAVHLDHDVPGGGELDRRLAAAGARAVTDGTTLYVGEYHAVPDVPRRTLVTGGARSGKSVEAERRLETFPRCCTWRRAGPGGRPGVGASDRTAPGQAAGLLAYGRDMRS